MRTRPTPFFGRRSLRTLCTVEIEHSENSLHAHVELDGDFDLGPGDRVRVHGPPIRPRFGERMVLRRHATVERAGWLERAWTRLISDFEFSELYDVSFTPGRAP
jgi:hypothetical protein